MRKGGRKGGRKREGGRRTERGEGTEGERECNFLSLMEIGPSLTSQKHSICLSIMR